VYRGFWREAYQRLTITNDFPEFTSRVCPALCEGSCTGGLYGEAVTIQAIERAISERAFASGWVWCEPPVHRTRKRVAVVGSGPAGLACANQLNQLGHSVTVFEQADRPGGLLMYGIPNMKLDKAFVLRRVRLMREQGVVFQTNTRVGDDYPVKLLEREFDAIVLACGARQPRELSVPGREAQGVHLAVDYLTASTKAILAGATPAISARGLHVVVIGGGDTGTDCVATCLRQGCRSVIQLEIMPARPKVRSPENPWPQWPQLDRPGYGQTEAVRVFGQDQRHFCQQTQAILTDGDGNVRAVQSVQVGPRPMAGSVQEWPADLVLLAMGFSGPESRLLDQLGLARDQRGNVPAEFFATSLPGVFAAGDVKRGQSLVAWAIAEGRAAAQACHRYLTGE
jgi:glutamate synthase (NADPH/NADH) small chain